MACRPANRIKVQSNATPTPRPPSLSVIVPTYREKANVPVLFERIKTALDGLPWEMIVVDDISPTALPTIC